MSEDSPQCTAPRSTIPAPNLTEVGIGTDDVDRAINHLLAALQLLSDLKARTSQADPLANAVADYKDRTDS